MGRTKGAMHPQAQEIDQPDGVRTLTGDLTHWNGLGGSSSIVAHENSELQPHIGQTSSSALYEALQSRQD